MVTVNVCVSLMRFACDVWSRDCESVLRNFSLHALKERDFYFCAVNTHIPVCIIILRCTFTLHKPNAMRYILHTTLA